jgi:molybdenum cofactor cytidylyltransferase
VIAAIVLAGGSSSRMGRPKQLLPFAGGTVLSTVVDRLLASRVDRVVVVLGHDADALHRRAGLSSDPRLAVVVNPDWAEGMASSLRCGVATCADADAVVIALGDQPGIEADGVDRLVEAFRSRAPLAVTVQGEERGHPVLFARSLFAELLALRGDVGAREVVARHWADVAKVAGSLLPDIDTPEDYEACAANEAARPTE